MILCTRCARPLPGDYCDYHEHDCDNDGTSSCWCDSSQKVCRACCLKCEPVPA